MRVEIGDVYKRAYRYLDEQVPQMRNLAVRLTQDHPHLHIDVINARNLVQVTCRCNQIIAGRPSGLLIVSPQLLKISVLRQEEIDAFEDLARGIILSSEEKLTKSAAFGRYLTTDDERKVLGFLSIWYFITPQISIFLKTIK